MEKSKFLKRVKNAELEYWKGLSLQKFFKMKAAIKIQSKLVDEDIWLVSTVEEMDQVKGPEVVYTAKEAYVLSLSSKEYAKKIHKIKKTFNGEIKCKKKITGSK